MSSTGVTPPRARPLIVSRRDREDRPMVTQAQSARTPRQASFRHLKSGAIVNTGCFHDITLLGDDADLDAWEAGFTDSEGRFYNREEAARAIGLRGRLE